VISPRCFLQLPDESELSEDSTPIAEGFLLCGAATTPLPGREAGCGLEWKRRYQRMEMQERIEPQ
jgi:hypothetical protein